MPCRASPCAAKRSLRAGPCSGRAKKTVLRAGPFSTTRLASYSHNSNFVVSHVDLWHVKPLGNIVVRTHKHNFMKLLRNS